eukprot:scaffold5017_cov56-Attheya_sp.AAC.1
MKIVGLSIVRTGTDVSVTVVVLETDIVTAQTIIGRSIHGSRTYLAFNSTVHCSRLTCSEEQLWPVPPQCD